MKVIDKYPVQACLVDQTTGIFSKDIPSYSPDKDKQGNFLPKPSNIILVLCPPGFNLPKWDFEKEKWIEGAEKETVGGFYSDLRQRFKHERDKKLSRITHIFSDGREVQVAVRDHKNFQMAIALGKPEEWILKNNETAVLTIAEMEEAVQSGMKQGKAIWDEYKANIKSLKEDSK